MCASPFFQLFANRDPRLPFGTPHARPTNARSRTSARTPRTSRWSYCGAPSTLEQLGYTSRHGTHSEHPTHSHPHKRCAHRHLRLRIRRAYRRARHREEAAERIPHLPGRFRAMPLRSKAPFRGRRIRAANRVVAREPRRENDSNRLQHSDRGGSFPRTANAARTRDRRGRARCACRRPRNEEPPRGGHRHEGNGGIRRLHQGDPSHRRGHHRLLHGNTALRRHC